MNVVIIGSGGREHAIAYKLRESNLLDKLYLLPGNPGTETLGDNVDIDVNNHEKVITFCNQSKIELVVVGPEQPLVDGLADDLRAAGIKCFGPNKNAAEIEGNKSFSKSLMQKYNIPTAAFQIFNISQKENAITYLDSIHYPTVIKASGLAAGKGVLICKNKHEARNAIKSMFDDKIFGESGSEVVIEEYMEGLEASIFAVTDGSDYVILPSSQDHKRIFNNDLGKNTGGMGAYAPAPLITKELLKQIDIEIIDKTIKAMADSGRMYNGCLYAGIMITKSGPKVIEFNCRFGDPETQVVLPILEGDLLKLLYSAANGKIDKNAVNVGNSCAVCIVASSKGYPDKYEKGKVIEGLDDFEVDETIIFHAGTKKENDKIVTGGGRVLALTKINRSGDLTACKKEAYNELDKIKFEGMHFRTDISDKAFRAV